MYVQQIINKGSADFSSITAFSQQLFNEFEMKKNLLLK